MSNSEPDSMEGIAIIGMNGRFPGAKNIEEFWQNLRNGVETITFFSDQELLASEIDPTVLKDPSYVKAKGALKDIELFDASFFGFNPREAEITDPQHRIFLECAWEALETAGYDSQRYEGRIGVYAGVGWNSYLFNNLYSKRDSISMGGQQTLIGSDKDFLTTRVSYKLNLTGPSINVQTGCSTSLVATSLACQSLLNYQCDIALAGGVTIYAPSKAGYFYQEGGVFSPDGHCRAFDAKSKGFVLGNGVGIVVLKRLEDALADGDCIHAIIKSSAINNDGSLKVGYTAPSIDGQAEVIAEALALADVEAETIGYIEAHGTGTALGDPIEITALTRAFRTSTEKKGFCAVGSVKTNVGHLDAAAGVTGLIKTVLALKHKLIPPSLHFEQPNPQIDFANSPFYVNTTLSEWKANGTPRRAGVSSFGIGGTNAHVILEEAPVVASGTSRPWQLVLLSAKTPSALETATINLAAHLEQHPDLNLADVAYTLKVGRRRFEHRRMVVCQDIDDVVKTLDYLEPQRVFTDFQESDDRPVVFMFPGQGAQYVNMALELYQTPIFREQIDRCAELLKPHLGLDLRHVLYPREEQTEKAAQQLRQTAIAQPALFAIEYALAQLWMAWGVRPQAMLGHSIGEYVAACLAGVFSLEEALAVVAARGRLMQQLPSGAMLAVSLPEDQVQSFLGEELSLAASNAPCSCVVSGSKEAIANLQNYLATIDVACRPLHTSHAFHSQMMNPIIGEFKEQVARLNLKPPQIPFVSNVTGTWITATEATDPSYWAKHLRQTVRFSAGVQELLKGSQVMLEVGPGRTLSTLVKQIPPTPLNKGGEADRVVLSSIRHPREPQSDVAFLLNTLGQLWMAGVQVDWSGFYAHEQRQRIPLPTYPFERRRYWIEPQKQASDSPKETLPKDERDRNPTAAYYKKPDIADWFYVPSWKQAIRGSRDLRAGSREKSCWLVFADACNVGAQVAKRLELDGEDVITVIPSKRFSKLSERQYTINPEQPDDYDALLKELQTLGQVPNAKSASRIRFAIAHLWSVTPKAQAQSGIEFFEKCQNLGFYSLLFLAQALGKQNISEPIDIVVVTNDIHDVTGVERLSPEKATVLGICKVIPQEYPHITCRSIDVVIPAAGTSHENKLIDQLIAELTAPSDSIVAYRGHHRWVQSFEPVRLDGTAGTQLREEGVYLIAGGLGGIGLEIAEYLAQTVRAKLILIGRSAFPKRDEWDQWLATHDEQDEVSQKLQKVQSLEELGAEVLSLSVDVANEAQMQAAIALATERFGQIHGVIYAAGIKLFSTVQEISRTQCETQFRPTVQGLFVLENVLQGKELDFCLLISSLSSVLGVLGMAAYPATHLFTDAFVHKHNQTNQVPWISANWDNWLTSKLAVELATKLEISTDLFMTAKEGVEVFQRILSLDTVSQIVISTVALQARIEQWSERESLRDTKRSNQDNSPSLHARPNLPNTYVAPRNEIEQIIANIWQELLGIEQVGIHDNFFELGGDSILIIQIITKTKKAGLSLTHTQVFEYPTIAELAVAGRTHTVLAEQGLVYGVVPLTPIQHWFFEQNLLDLHHWNQAIRLEVQQLDEVTACPRSSLRGSGDPALLEQVVQQLLVHHDALRLRFVQEESGWTQIHGSPDAVVPFSHVDLSALSPRSQEEAFEAAAAQLQATLNLSSGPLVRVALFDLGAHKPSRLLIVIHHLAVDVGSWRILLEDLQTAYEQLSQGKTIKLPPKTTSFKQWSERLIEYAQSAQLQQLDYWLAAPPEQVSPLPVDYPGGANNVASARIVSVTLSIEETQALLEVPAAYRVQIDDVLLTALVQAFAEWTGTQSLLVDLEGRGRDVIFDDVDLSRTVGWFTNIAPVLLDLGEFSQLGEALKVVKEQIRSFPDHGLGYGVLRYLSGNTAITEKLRSLQEAEVIFLYLGQLEQTLPESSLFEFSQEFSGPPRSLRGKRSHLLEVSGLVTQGQMKVDWTYSENVHRRDTVEGLAQDFITALRSLITHCQSPSVENYTPSDFAEFKSSQWSQADLDNIMAALGKSESFEAP